MKLLLNGCSYGAEWKHFPGINLSQHGCSFYRCIRTTIEYCATHGNPDAVLIPITFLDRDEYITQVEKDIEIEGPYNKSNTIGEIKKLNITFNMLHDSDYASYDKFFLQITMFASWLDQQKISYLMWNQCNLFDRNYIKKCRAINKLKYVENNKRIINLYEFCANSYMYNNGALLNDSCTNDPQIAHYSYIDYEKILVPFLQDYIQKNNLGITGINNTLPSIDELEEMKRTTDPNQHSWIDM